MMSFMFGGIVTRRGGGQYDDDSALYLGILAPKEQGISGLREDISRRGRSKRMAALLRGLLTVERFGDSTK
jgi:hypothetical protein